MENEMKPYGEGVLPSGASSDDVSAPVGIDDRPFERLYGDLQKVCVRETTRAAAGVRPCHLVASRAGLLDRSRRIHPCGRSSEARCTTECLNSSALRSTPSPLRASGCAVRVAARDQLV